MTTTPPIKPMNKPMKTPSAPLPLLTLPLLKLRGRGCPSTPRTSMKDKYGALPFTCKQSVCRKLDFDRQQ